MNKIILDEALRAKLNGLTQDIKLCDEAGNTLGHFLPIDIYKELLFAWADKHFPPEEMERLRNETGGRSLAEIWKSLGRT